MDLDKLLVFVEKIEAFLAALEEKDLVAAIAAYEALTVAWSDLGL